MAYSIFNEQIKGFTDRLIEKYGNENKIEYNEKVCFWCEKLLEKRGILNAAVQQAFVDIIYSAALTHNLFIDSNDTHKYYEIFKAREVLTDDNETIGDLPVEFFNSYCQLIESQFGEQSPIPQMRPTPDSPQSTLADAKFIVDTIASTCICD